MVLRLLSYFLVIFYSFTCFSYSYEELRIKDYEEMKEIVSQHVVNSRSGSGDQSALSVLQKGLNIVLSRPDTDNLIESLLPPLIIEINNHGPFLNTLHDTVKKAISQYKQASDLDSQATALYVLENAMAYAKVVSSKETDSIFQSIKASKIKMSKELKSYLYLNLSRSRANHPYKTASDILKIRIQKREAEAAKNSEKTEEKDSKKKSFFQRLFGL